LPLVELGLFLLLRSWTINWFFAGQSVRLINTLDRQWFVNLYLLAHLASTLIGGFHCQVIIRAGNQLFFCTDDIGHGIKVVGGGGDEEGSQLTDDGLIKEWSSSPQTSNMALSSDCDGVVGENDGQEEQASCTEQKCGNKSCDEFGCGNGHDLFVE